MTHKIEVERKTLEDLNYNLADLLVYIEGFRTCIKMNPHGNKEQREAFLDLCNWVDKAAKQSKLKVSELISG